MEKINAKEISLHGTSSDHVNFCKLWPAAKTGLEALVTIIKNPIVKGAINLIINAGDSISKNVCV